MSGKDLRSQFLDEVKKRRRLFTLRNARGQTQEEVAKSVGATRGQYNQWEQGNVPIPSYYLRKIADYFRVSVDYLLGGDEPPILGPLEEVIKELQWYKETIKKGTSNQLSVNDLVLEQLLRVGQKVVESTATSIYLINNLKNPSLLLRVLAIGYSEKKKLTTPEQYDIISEPTRTTVKVFTDGNVEVKRNRNEIEHDIYRGSSDAGCGSYAIVPLWTMDAVRFGVLKFENHIDDNPYNPFTDKELNLIIDYSTIIAEFLEKNNLCAASHFQPRSLAV